MTEYCDGGTLADLVEANAKAGHSVRLCASLCLALQHMHDTVSVCHRYVQSANIQLTQQGRVKLTWVGTGVCTV